MIDPVLNEQIVSISDNIGSHVDLFLEFKHSLIPSTRFKYPSLVLRTDMIQNDYWLLWGLTYRMTGFILSAMQIDHHMRYKQLSKGSLMRNQILFVARNFLKLDVQWKSAGIEPYFAKTKRSKL